MLYSQGCRLESERKPIQCDSGARRQEITWLGFLLQPSVMAAFPTATFGGDNGVELSIVTCRGSGISADKCLHCDDIPDLLPEVCDESAASGSYSSPKPFDSGTDDGNPTAPAFTSLDSVGIVPGPIALP